MGRYDDPPFGRRRPAGGERPGAPAPAPGTGGWAERWAAVLERLVDPWRLEQGRIAARRGQVIRLDVGATSVEAEVRSAYSRPYAVRIRFKPLPDAVWDNVISALAGQALYAARLLNGELPAPVEDVFAAAGTSLVPTARGDLQARCSCGARGGPCTHIAAVYAALGARFAADPFLICALRGRDKDAISAALRARRAAPPAAPALPAAEPAAAPETAPPLRESLAGFWAAPAPGPAGAPIFRAPALTALAVKRLGPPPFRPGERDFTLRMEATYQAIGIHALGLALGEEGE